MPFVGRTADFEVVPLRLLVAGRCGTHGNARGHQKEGGVAYSTVEKYQAWRKKYEQTTRFRERVRLYSAKRRKDPALKETLKRYAHTWRKNHRLNYMVYRAIKRATDKGIEFDRGFLEELAATKPTNCDCCGVQFNYGVQAKGRQGHPATPSLDRVDPTIGYVRGNTAIICLRCNVLKKNGSLLEFRNILSYVERYARG